MAREQLSEGISGLKSRVARPIYVPSTYQCCGYKCQLYLYWFVLFQQIVKSSIWAKIRSLLMDYNEGNNLA